MRSASNKTFTVLFNGEPQDLYYGLTTMRWQKSDERQFVPSSQLLVPASSR